MPNQAKKRVYFTLTQNDIKLINALESEGISAEDVIRDGLSKLGKRRAKKAKKIYSKVGVK